ncbi:hypothetical protein BH10BDE1_BH10BDE1_15370 [soil metagenome]
MKKARSFTFLTRRYQLCLNLDSRRSRVNLLALVSLCVAFIFTGLALWQVTNLKTRYALTEFLAANDPSLKEDVNLRSRFKLTNAPWMFVVAERHTGWSSIEAIQDLANATTLITETKGVKSVASLGTLETIVREHGEVRLGRVTDVLKTRDWKKLVSQTGIVAPVLISQDGQWATMLIELDEMDSNLLLQTKDDVEFLLRKKMSASQVMVGGVSIVQAELTRVLSKEISLLGGLGGLIATLALMALFSGFSAVIIAAVTCFSSNAVILGTMAYTGQSLGVLSLSLPILIAVQTLSLTVHILFAYIEARATLPRRAAVVHSFKRLLLPNLLVSLATGVGFLTLASSNVVAMRDFGMTVALASLGLWLMTTLIIYPLLMFMPEPGLRRFVSGRARWTLKIMKYRLAVLGLLGTAVLLALATGLHVNYSHRLFDDLAKNSSSSQAAQILDHNLGGLVPVEIELALKSDSWLEPQNRARLVKVASLLRKIPSVGSVITPLDLFSFAGAAPTDSASIAEVQTLFEMAAKNPLKNFLRDDGRSARLSVRMRDVPSDQLEAGLKEISRSIASVAPASETKIAGWGSYIHRMNRELSQSLISGFWEALAVIFLLLLAVFRSVRWAAVSLLPSVMPPLFLIAVVSFFNIEMKPGLAIVFAIALGFAFINTIYLMKRIRDVAGQTKSGRVSARVIERAFWHESQSCLLSSLTLLIGFTTLCFSDFGVTRSFGVAMVFSMLAGVVGDLVLLPAFLRQFPDLLNPRRGPHHRGLVNVATASVVAVLFAISSSTSIAATRATAAEAETLPNFAKAAAKALFARDEKVEVELTNVESDGGKETRKIELSRLTTKNAAKPKEVQQKIVARILEPKSLKGTSVLTVTDGESQSRWIYIPSSKQVRRVVGGDEAGAPILGSELSTEDLDLSQVDGATAKIVSREGGIVTIESKITNKDSAYSKCVARFDETTRLMKSAECLDRKGQPFKRISVLGYRQLKGAISRPTEMKIENLKTKRFTKIVFSDQKVNTGLKPSQFTPEALKD